MAQKIPATVITGFLGAGKTSMIRHLLSHPQGRRIALIINEFGDLGVDGEILSGCCAANDVMELANGCICCTVADDFLPLMESLLERPQPLDHIVIETSGLALPKPLVKAFHWPAIRTRVTVDGVITVVDAPAVLDGRFASDVAALQAPQASDTALDHDSPLAELFEEQLGCADLVVLNKIDQVLASALASVQAQVVKHTRPAVRVINACHGALSSNVLLGLKAGAEDDLDSRPSHIDDGVAHDHDDFTSFHLELTEISTPESLLERLQMAMNKHPILRIKGFIAVNGKDMRLLIQGVGDRIQHYYDRPWNANERRSRLIVIATSDVDQAAVRRLIMEGAPTDV